MQQFLGVDMGGTKTLVGIVSECGDILCKERYQTKKKNQSEAEETLFGSVADFAATHDISACDAIGVGTVGHIDPDIGIWIQSYNIPISTPVAVSQRLEDTFGLRGYIDNDVHCATLAEQHFGKGRGVRSLLYINVGTGLSVGIADHGKLLRGADNYAGEAGYMELNADSGNGNFEKICSGGGMIAAAKEILSKAELAQLVKTDQLNVSGIFALSKESTAAKALCDRASRFLGYGVANLASVVNPDTIVFGGGATACAEYIDSAILHFHEHCVRETQRSICYIGVSSLGGADVGLLGAAALAKTKTEETR